jgi:hypothetical protein
MSHALASKVLTDDLSRETCGKASDHGYADRRAQVADALVALINRSEVIATVKGEQD